ncbi:MAG: PAS domain S-box protein [Crocinitomicaceae bacterium]|nr:PAS domain S-box protein [Crocinitomicaceae bacterium]
MSNRLPVDTESTLKEILQSVKAFAYEFNFNDEGSLTGVEFVSENIENIYGISREEYLERIRDGKINELFDPETRDKTVENFHKTLIIGERTTFRYQLKNGNWVQEKINPTHREDGNHVAFGIIQNVTNEVREEESKNVTELKYQQLFDRNLAGVFRTHVDGYVMNCNQAFCDILGYESPEEIKSRPVQDLYYYPSSRTGYLDELREKKYLSKHISILKRKDGRKLIVNNNVGIFPDETGELNIIEGTLVDVTQEYETSISLQQSEQRYKLIFESTNISILLLTFLDSEFYILQGNTNANKLLKVKERNGLTGLELSSIFKSKPDFNNTMKMLLDYDKTQEEQDIIDLEGNHLNVELYFSHVQIENEQIIQLVIKDNTSKRRNQLELENSQRNFKNIVDTSPAAIFIFSESDELLYSNTLGDQVLKNQFKTESKQLKDIFAKDHYDVIKHLANSSTNAPYIEIDLKGGTRFSVKLVNITYNNEPAKLISLTDVTLQYQFNTQKLRAEIAEESNFELEKEIVQHKRTQEELLEKSSRLNAFIDSSANLYIATLNRKFEITSMNSNFHKEFVRQSDFTPKIGGNLFDIITTSERGKQWFEHKLKRTFAGQDQVIVSKFPTNTGKELWVEIFLNPIKIGGKTSSEISIIAHDISEKLENERLIKASESRNRALLQAIPDLIFRVTSEGVFTDFKINNLDDSEIFYEFTTTKDIIGKKLIEVFSIDGTAADFMEYVKKSIETDQLITHYYKIKREVKGKNRTLYYENRYSKISDNEVLIIARNITDQEENEVKLRDSLKEKEILLKEVHHRVKNNLQVINSILNLQTSYIEDPNTLEFINESQNRIRSMSFIHESLYLTENFSSINFLNYITNLVNNLFHSYQTHDNRINLNLDVAETHLLLDQAIPCGLVLNELLSNALKYAFPDERKGELHVSLKEVDGKIHLMVKDDGVGLPKDFDLKNLDSLGLNLVEVLVEQLDGTLELESNKGTKFLIIFDKAEA